MRPSLRLRRLRFGRFALPAPCVLVVLLGLAASPTGAAPELEAGFRSVVEVLGPRAVWVNPAAIGLSSRPSLLAEGTWRQVRGASGEDSWESTPASGGIAVSMPASGYAWQWEGEDRDGAADWTLSWGQRRSTPGGISFGTAFEWRGGEDSAIDWTLGLILPVGRSLQAAGVVRDLLESDRDGVPVERTWRTGLAWIPRSWHGRLLWDTLWGEGRPGGTVHWFGGAFDLSGGIRLRWLGDFDDEWNGSVGIDVGGVGVEGGYRRVRFAPDGAWIALEWRGARIPR